MDESKELVGMAVSVLLAVLVLSGVMALITISYSIWNMFSQQDLANRKMKEYVNYASFDDTVVRGQEVISLLSDTQGMPFVIILDSQEHGAGVLAAAYNNVTYDYQAGRRTSYSTSHSGAIRSTLENIIGVLGTPVQVNSIFNSAHDKWNFSTSAPEMKDLQEWFLDRGTNYQDDDGNTMKPCYCGYNSCIVYDSDSSTDIIGIILQEVKPSTGG